MLSRSEPQLVVAAPTSVARRSASIRRVQTAISSSGGFVVSISLCVAFGYIGVLSAVLATCMMLCLGLLAMQSAVVRRSLDHHAALLDREQRERIRQVALASLAQDRRQQYVELLTLVRRIEQSDPTEARRRELEPLLDCFVQLSRGQQRCLESLRMSAISIAAEAAGTCNTQRPSRRDEIVARRTRHRDESSAWLVRVVDEIEATDELIRLLAQRAAYASLEPLIDLEIDRRLADLDDYDAALHQLSA